MSLPNIETIMERRQMYMFNLELFINNSIDNILPVTITLKNIFKFISILPRDSQEIITELFSRQEGENKDDYYNS